MNWLNSTCEILVSSRSLQVKSVQHNTPFADRRMMNKVQKERYYECMLPEAEGIHM